MMRKAGIMAALAVVLVVGSAAMAIPFRISSYQGPVTMKFTSWDMGTVYTPPAALVDGIAAVNAQPQSIYPAANGHYFDTNGLRDDAIGYNPALREDGWGIVLLDKIYVSGGNPNVDILWQAGDGGKEIAVLFVGLVDNAIAPGARVGEEVIQSQDVRFFMYENPLGTFNPALGSSGRTGFAAYTGITGGILLLAGSSQPNVGAIIGSTGPDEFVANFKPDASLVTGAGTFESYIELDAATALLQRDYNQFNTDAMTPWLYDFTVNGTTKPNNGTVAPIVGNWTVLNEDPFRGNVIPIPEPATMLCAFMGIGGLVEYIRRRRLA